MDTRPGGIVALVRTNRNFRRLWYGQIVSQAGDWFNQIAVMALLYRLTGSGQVVGASLILRMLPGLLVAPIAGVLVDRLDKKRILVGSDLLRAAVLPLFVIAVERESVTLVYVLLGAQVCVSAFFDPARSAVLPAIVAPHELLAANALTSMTWSLMLSIGAAAGGAVVATLGLGAAFVIDGASFLLSALFIAGMHVPRDAGGTAPAPERPTFSAAPGAPAAAAAAAAGVPPRSRTARGFADLAAGMRYLAGNRGILTLVCVKTGVGIGAGMVLLMTIFSERVFHEAEPGMTLGLLFLARGIGTAVGPFLGRAISGYDEEAMRRLLPFGFVQAAIFFAAFGFAPNLASGFALLVLAHLGTSMNWVFSSVLLQIRVEAAYRGRVFAAEMALFTVSFCASTFLVGLALDAFAVSPRTLAVACGSALALPTAATLLVRRSRRRAASPPGSS